MTLPSRLFSVQVMDCFEFDRGFRLGRGQFCHFERKKKEEEEEIGRWQLNLFGKYLIKRF